MIFQRVTDLAEPTNNFRRHVEQSMIRASAINLDEDENDNSTNNLPKLVDLPPDDDGPDIFKRVQLLTRWEDRRESRGRMAYRHGDYFIWNATGYDRMMMVRELQNNCNTQRNWIVSRPRSAYLAFSITFIGKSIANSRPVIMVYAPCKKNQRRFFKVTQQVDWVRHNPRILVLVCLIPEFVRSFQDAFEEVWRKYHHNRLQ